MQDQVSREPTVEWKSPDRGTVKLNCTSLWDPNSKTARLGGILGDDEGALIEAGICNYSQPCIDEFAAAAYSIKSYIKFHSRFVSTKIVVESDNKLLVDCLSKWSSSSKKRVRSSFQSTLDDIINVASKFKSYTFVLCERQTNAAAILLAKHAAPTPYTWPGHKNIREWLATVLMEDSPPPKAPNQEPDPKAQKQELVAKDSEAASDELKTTKQSLAVLLENT